MPSKPLRLIHLSDLHFAHATYDPRQLLSKRWLGNLNLILFRNKTMQTTPLWELPQFFKDLGLEHAIISGDMTTTSHPKEFTKAINFVDTLKTVGLTTYLVPGNHDVYTKESDKKKLFYDFFQDDLPALKEKRMAKRHIQDKFWWVGLDTALATPLWLSNGLFTEKMAFDLDTLLSSIPKEAIVIMTNHFPLFETGHPRHDLKGGPLLQKVLQAHPNVKLFLHGHDHSAQVIDCVHKGYPLVLNSGSASDGAERTFSFLEITPSYCKLITYRWNGQSWTPKSDVTYPICKK